MRDKKIRSAIIRVDTTGLSHHALPIYKPPINSANVPRTPTTFIAGSTVELSHNISFQTCRTNRIAEDYHTAVSQQHTLGQYPRLHPLGAFWMRWYHSSSPRRCQVLERSIFWWN